MLQFVQGHIIKCLYYNGFMAWTFILCCRFPRARSVFLLTSGACFLVFAFSYLSENGVNLPLPILTAHEGLECDVLQKKETRPKELNVTGWKRSIRNDCHIRSQMFVEVYRELADRESALADIKWSTVSLDATFNHMASLLTTELPQFQPIDDTYGYVVSAFLDNRGGSYPDIKVLYITPFTSPIYFCQLKCGNRYVSIEGRPHFLPVFRPAHVNCIWQPYLLHCLVQSSDCDVTRVSVTSSPCVLPTNQMTVNHVEHLLKPREEFGVCLNTLFDMSPEAIPKFVQFMESVRILGNARVYLYGSYNSSSSARNAIQYYTKRGSLHYYSWVLPDKVTSLFYFGQVLQNMDCLYRHMSERRYILFLDMDEILLPFKHRSWPELLSYLEEGRQSYMEAGLSFQRLRTFPDPHVPPLSLQRSMIDRAVDPRAYTDAACLEPQPKMLVRPRKTLQVGVHFIDQPLRPFRHGRTVNLNLGAIVHLRKSIYRCTADFVQSDTNKTFNSAWKAFTRKLVPRMARVLQEITDLGPVHKQSQAK